MDCDFNLFGEQLPANHGERGRPQHVATSENRNKVMMLLAAGWTVVRIAKALGISAPTLREHYFSELQMRAVAYDRVKAQRFSMLFEQMKAGSVPAHKEFDRMLQREHLALAEARMRKAPKKEQVGKKQAREAAAPEAHKDTPWEGLLPNTETMQ